MFFLLLFCDLAAKTMLEKQPLYQPEKLHDVENLSRHRWSRSAEARFTVWLEPDFQLLLVVEMHAKK